MLDRLVSDEEVVRVGVLERDLRLPPIRLQVGLVLEAQTGLRKSDRLSALSRRGPRECEEGDGREE